MSARTIQCNQRCRRSPRSTTAELFWDTSSRYLQSLRCGDAFFDNAQYMKRKLWPRRTREPAGRLATSGCLCAVASYFQKRVVYRTDRAARAFSLLWAFRKEHAESWRNMMVIYTFAKQGLRYSTSAFLRKFKLGSLKKSHWGNQHLNLLPCNLSSRKVLFQRYSAIILTIRMSRVLPSIHRWR